MIRDPPQTGTVPGLQRIIALRSMLRCARDTRLKSMGSSSLQTDASQVPAAKGDSSRPCPACGRASSHTFRFRINDCDILQCRECGLGRAETSGFDPTAYYTEDYFSGRRSDGYSDYLGAEPVLRCEFARSVDFIRCYREGGKLLELGCAYGFFLMEAARYFDVAGIELAAQAADHGRREVAAHDPAAAPVVLHPGEHAPLVRRPRAFGGASGPSLEARSGVADRLPVAANARPARPRREHRQPGRHACQPVRCHAHRPAQSRVRNSAAPQLLRGPWVPGECSERICASGTSPGTQCEKRGAHYWIAQQCRFIGDSPALPRVRLAAGQGRNFFRPAALLVAPAANLSLSRNAEGPKGPDGLPG